jgi:hypothetical protein
MRGGQPSPLPPQFILGDILLGKRPLRDPVFGNQLAKLNFRGMIIRDFPAPNQDVLFGANAVVHLNTGGMLAVQDSFLFSSTQSTGAIVGAQACSLVRVAKRGEKSSMPAPLNSLITSAQLREPSVVDVRQPRQTQRAKMRTVGP